MMTVDDGGRGDDGTVHSHKAGPGDFQQLVKVHYYELIEGIP